ncbi:extracellular solute-binding protein [Roseomonas sp. USHLN139]|uniref:extracellular solute-binding protein n=1 Tax=Roseomonas sp. USHLN139 TaxID=3081298 RepID=UPI003B023BBB
MPVTRRGLILAGTGLALPLAAPRILRAQTVREIRMIEAGGKSGESMEPYIRPFTAATGTKVVRESPNPFGKLRTLVQAGRPPVVLFEVGSTQVKQGEALNLLEPLDWNAIAPDEMYPEARLPLGFGWQYYSTLMAWRSDAKAPKTWADFFNTRDFPGKRSLQDRPYTLAFALLADGVPPEKLFPLDMDRAFRVLERIKKDVAVWWTAGAQPPQLLRDNEVQYAASYSGRVAATPGISYTFDFAALDCAYLVVPRGADPADKAAAMRLLREFSKAPAQAEAAAIISYTGPSPALTPLLPQDKLAEFPTAHRDKQFQHDVNWWYDNAEIVERRWQQFKLGF